MIIISAVDVSSIRGKTLIYTYAFLFVFSFYYRIKSVSSFSSFIFGVSKVFVCLIEECSGEFGPMMF